MTDSMQRRRALWLKKRFPNRRALLAQAKRDVAAWHRGAKLWNAELSPATPPAID
ncbi:MAG: hypothetical protein JWN23_1558 [Rhodocyclales bacterium]|nr:hypothetical protein [Rhodocyclales bacterium]